MSGSNGKGSKAARRRGPRRAAGGRLVLAGRGNGWELWVPEDDWRAMSDHERARLVEGQAALMQPARASTRPPRRSATIAGALDQLTTARPVQLALFGSRP